MDEVSLPSSNDHYRDAVRARIRQARLARSSIPSTSRRRAHVRSSSLGSISSATVLASGILPDDFSSGSDDESQVPIPSRNPEPEVDPSSPEAPIDNTLLDAGPPSSTGSLADILSDAHSSLSDSSDLNFLLRYTREELRRRHNIPPTARGTEASVLPPSTTRSHIPLSELYPDHASTFSTRNPMRTPETSFPNILERIRSRERVRQEIRTETTADPEVESSRVSENVPRRFPRSVSSQVRSRHFLDSDSSVSPVRAQTNRSSSFMETLRARYQELNDSTMDEEIAASIRDRIRLSRAIPRSTLDGIRSNLNNLETERLERDADRLSRPSPIPPTSRPNLSNIRTNWSNLTHEHMERNTERLSRTSPRPNLSGIRRQSSLDQLRSQAAEDLERLRASRSQPLGSEYWRRQMHEERFTLDAEMNQYLSSTSRPTDNANYFERPERNRRNTTGSDSDWRAARSVFQLRLQRLNDMSQLIGNDSQMFLTAIRRIEGERTRIRTEIDRLHSLLTEHNRSLRTLLSLQREQYRLRSDQTRMITGIVHDLEAAFEAAGGENIPTDILRSLQDITQDISNNLQQMMDVPSERRHASVSSSHSVVEDLYIRSNLPLTAAEELGVTLLECAICLCCYEPRDLIRTLPCGHMGHSSCLDKWLILSASCPECRLHVDI